MDIEQIKKMVDELKAAIQIKERENAADKLVVNRLLTMAGEPEFFTDAGPVALAPAAPPARTIKRGQFAGEPGPAAASRAFLAFIGKETGGAVVEEIHDALVKGGFGFNSGNAEAQKAGLRVAMGKDPKIVFVGDDVWGLAEWWPNRASPRKKAKAGDDSGSGTAEPENEEEVAAKPAAKPEVKRA